MVILDKKIKNYKSKVIRNFIPFYMSGLLTAEELESLSNVAVLSAFKEGVFNGKL